MMKPIQAGLSSDAARAPALEPRKLMGSGRSSAPTSNSTPSARALMARLSMGGASRSWPRSRSAQAVRSSAAMIWNRASLKGDADLSGLEAADREERLEHMVGEPPHKPPV